MDDIKRILVLSRSTKYCQKAVRYGILLAKKHGAELSVLHAIHNPFGLEGWNVPLPSHTVLAEEYERMQQEARRDLDKMIEQLNERCKGRQPSAVFHADCAARGRWSLNRVMKDEIIHRMQYPLIQDGTVPWLGMYGFGEFTQLGGRNRFHQFTTSLFLILRKE